MRSASAPPPPHRLPLDRRSSGWRKLTALTAMMADIVNETAERRPESWHRKNLLA